MRTEAPRPADTLDLGDPIAMLRQEPEDLAKALRLKFRNGHDDLDWLQLARVRTANGRTFALVRHRNAPEPGTEVVAAAPSSDIWEDITAVLERLNLTERDLRWCHPSVRRVPSSASKRKSTSPTRTGTVEAVSTVSGLSRKQVGSVFAALGAVAAAELVRRGTFTLPGAARLQIVRKVARKAAKKAAGAAKRSTYKRKRMRGVVSKSVRSNAGR